MKMKIIRTIALFVVAAMLFSFNTFAVYSENYKSDSSYSEPEHLGKIESGDNRIELVWKNSKDGLEEFKNVTFEFTAEETGVYYFGSSLENVVFLSLTKDDKIIDNYYFFNEREETYGEIFFLNAGDTFIAEYFVYNINNVQVESCCFSVDYFGRVTDINIDEKLTKDVIYNVDTATRDIYDVYDDILVGGDENSVEVALSEYGKMYLGLSDFSYSFNDFMEQKITERVKPGVNELYFRFGDFEKIFEINVIVFDDCFKELKIDSNSNIIEYYDSLSCEDVELFCLLGGTWVRYNYISEDWLSENNVCVVFKDGQTAPVQYNDYGYYVVAPNGKEYQFTGFDTYDCGNDKVGFCLYFENYGNDYSNYLRMIVDKRKATRQENAEHFKSNMNEKINYLEELSSDGFPLTASYAFLTALRDEIIIYVSYLFDSITQVRLF